MSSTEEAKLRAFFREKLVPAAIKLRERGVELFPVGPDPDAESWWEPGPTEEEFVELAPEEIEAALVARWQAADLPELVALAEPLMKLARELEVTEEPSSEVSPFVYVMY
jgi:hypothetical protein